MATGSKSKSKINIKWLITAILLSFIIAMSLGTISEFMLGKADILMAFVILIFVILLGVLFDLIGIAAAAAIEKPFHSMAANKVYGAKHSIKLIRNAGMVSSFCNDIMGDISGILSGTIVGIIIIKLASKFTFDRALMSTILSSFVAALTIGLKAAEKDFAVNQSNDIILIVGKIISWISIHLKIDILH